MGSLQETSLQRLHTKTRFDIEFVDIEADRLAGEKYGERMPVIAVDGAEVAAAPLDEQEFAALLAV